MDIKILTDSTCDLPRELMEEYDISVIPLHINLGERSLLDGEEVTPQNIFAHVAAGGELPSTAAINLSRFQEAFAGYASGHDAVICITIGSGFSSCFQNASAAAGDFSNVYVVDSQNLSAGQGIAVLSAARMARRYFTAAARRAFRRRRSCPGSRPSYPKLTPASFWTGWIT